MWWRSESLLHIKANQTTADKVSCSVLVSRFTTIFYKMDSLLRLFVLLLLWNITLNLDVSAGVVPKSDSTHDIDLSIKMEVMNIETTESLDEIKDRLSALEEIFKKLYDLSDLRREHDNNILIAMQALKNQYSSIESQLKSLQTAVNALAGFTDGKAVSEDFVKPFKCSHVNLANERPKLDIRSDFETSTSKITQPNDSLKSQDEEMKTNGYDYVTEVMKLAEALASEVTSRQNDPDEIKLNDNAIFDQTVDIIRDTTIKFLVKAMKKGGDYKTRVDVHTLAGVVYALHPKISDQVMQGLVDGTYGNVAPDTILQNIFSHSITAQAISGINALFWKLKNDGKVNNPTVVNIASSLSKLQQKSQFGTLSEERKIAVDKVIENIPTCARNLFFNSSAVCLWNKARDTYLIAADSSFNYDSARRNIFTHSPPINSSMLNGVPTGAAWIPVKIDDKILFRSVDYTNEYLYVAAIDYNSKMRYVFNWISGDNTDDQSAFNIQLDGDHCYLKSNSFNQYLFASDVKYENNDSYSYVFTGKQTTLGGNSEFVWQIRGC